MNNENLEFHSISNGFPMASDNEFEALVDSIETIGQLENIILFEGKILDGRNRYIACNHLKIQPKIEEFFGTFDAAISLSNAKNSSRRHLTSGQKAFAALYAIIEANERGIKITQNRAAKIYAVSYKYIQHAATIYNESDVLADAVFRGKISLTKAHKQVIEKTSSCLLLERSFLQENIKDLSEAEAIRFTQLSQLQPVTLILKIIKLEKGN